MKKLGFFLFLIFSHMMLSQNLDECRELMRSGENSQRSAQILIEKSSIAYKKTKQPIFAGFSAVGQFFMAKHVFNPFKKLSYFNDGRKTMDEAIRMDPDNIEIRLMRLITQEKAPVILGYTHNISEDKNFIIKEYKNSPDGELKSYIKNYLKL